jgi:eukaryotic-like serine/threonine-protein kinase
MATEDQDQAGGANDPLVGTVIDRRYRIEHRLAAGGFGSIYGAVHVITGQQVALKVLHSKLATERDVVARFRREGLALAQLRSQHTISAYDFGETNDGTLYIVMELLQGESLWERFSAMGPLPWRRLVKIARQVCSSLAEAHALGIVHRDLKPTNIHLERVGADPDFVKVLDFGIAKILHGSSIDAVDLTKSGMVVGTFDYMAPEQMVGSQLSGQSDIYTVGLVMYEMLAGQRAFGEQPTPSAMLTAMLSKTPVPPSTIVEAPPELDAVILRCLQRDPSDRFRDVLELGDALDHLLLISRDANRTQVAVRRAPSAPMSIDDRAAAEDSLTWIDKPPQAPPVSAPATTLPGIAPPVRNSPWPFSDPRKKR